MNSVDQGLNICVINCDWSDMYRNSFTELRDKLSRDRLNPDRNTFFFFSWSRKYYIDRRDDRFGTIHLRMSRFVPHLFLDIFSVFILPIILLTRRQRVDVFICHDFGFLPAGLLAKAILALTGQRVKIVMILNNLPKQYSGIRRFGRIKSFYSAAVEFLAHWIPDAYLTINNTVRDYLLALGVRADKIHIFAMDTINREKDFIEQSTAGKIRQRFNIPTDAKVVVSVGRLEVEKRHELMLEYLARLADKNIYLFILGRGSLSDFLQNKIKELGLENRVFLPGFIDRREIWNFYRDADVFVLLSRAEALGVVFWEAMWVNVPVIGSDEPGIVESLGASGERGFALDLSQTDSFDQFSQALSFCLTTSIAKSEMLARAKEFVGSKIANSLDINRLIADLNSGK